VEGWINHGGFQQPGKGRDVMRCDCAVTTGESLVQGESAGGSRQAGRACFDRPNVCEIDGRHLGPDLECLAGVALAAINNLVLADMPQPHAFSSLPRDSAFSPLLLSNRAVPSSFSSNSSRWSSSPRG
jgi:hypothetical protein